MFAIRVSRVVEHEADHGKRDHGFGHPGRPALYDRTEITPELSQDYPIYSINPFKFRLYYVFIL